MKKDKYKIYFTGQFIYTVEFEDDVTPEEAEAYFINGDFYDVTEEEVIDILEVDRVE